MICFNFMKKDVLYLIVPNCVYIEVMIESGEIPVSLQKQPE